jgi:hypothetical protein
MPDTPTNALAATAPPLVVVVEGRARSFHYLGFPSSAASLFTHLPNMHHPSLILAVSINPQFLSS